MGYWVQKYEVPDIMTEMLRVNALAILTPPKEISDSFHGAKYE